jgi:tRNA 2-thiouridine synthesizing protein A
MSRTVDARGLSCPQPVLMTMDEIKKVGKGKLLILVDTDTSKENREPGLESKGYPT